MLTEEWIIGPYRGKLPKKCGTCEDKKCIYDCPVLEDIIETFYFSFK